MRFTLKQLEYFVATAQCGSIKQAAQKVSISQPSISTAITSLEKIWGVQLFVRHHAQGLSLTTSGKTMMREARLLLRQAAALENAAGEVANEVCGTLAVGCLVTLAPMVVPELSHTFTAVNPGVELQFTEGDPKSLIEKLRQVEIDVAVTYDLNVPPDVGFEPLATLPPRVLVAQNHPLARRKNIRLEDIAHEPLVLLDLPYSRQYFLELFAQAGLEPNIETRSSSQEVVRTMVASGFGYTIANVRPINMAALDGKRLESLALAGDHAPMTTGIVTLNQDHKPRTLEAFESHCRSLITNNRIPGMQLT